MLKVTGVLSCDSWDGSLGVILLIFNLYVIVLSLWLKDPRVNRLFVAIVTLFRALPVVLYPVGSSSVPVVKTPFTHLLLELRMLITADEEVVLDILVLLS